MRSWDADPFCHARSPGRAWRPFSQFLYVTGSVSFRCIIDIVRDDEWGGALTSVSHLRWLPCLLLALVLLFAPLAALGAALLSPTVNAAQHIASGPLVNCSGALAPC